MYKNFSLTQSLIFTEAHRTFPQGCGPQCVQLCRVLLHFGSQTLVELHAK